MEPFDVIVIGAGMVGQALLRALRSTPLRVACVEAKAPTEHGSDQRAITLSPSSVRLLTRLGVWSRLCSHAVPMQAIDISHHHHAGVATLSAHEMSLDALGYVIAAEQLHAVLNDDVPGVTWFRPAKVELCAPHGDLATVQVQQPHGCCALQAKLVLATDGQHSTMARLVGIDHDRYPYHQTACVTSIQTSGSHQGVAHERFLPSGALALLPMTQRRMGVVWAKDVALDTPDDWLSTLQQSFGTSLGTWSSMGSVQQFPLHGARARQLTCGRVVLLGHAANSLHPIAGQGFNLGLRDVMVMAAQCDHTHRQGQDIGGTAVLQAYSQQRQRDHQVTFSLTHSLHRHARLAHPWGAISWYLGLGLMEHVLPLKQLLTRVMMGYALPLDPVLSHWLGQPSGVVDVA